MTAVSFTQVNSLNKLTNVVNGAAQNGQGTDFSEVLKANNGKQSGLDIQNVASKDAKKTDDTKKQNDGLNLETSGKRAEEQKNDVAEKVSTVGRCQRCHCKSQI